jgi:hypothetical protein
MATSSVSNKVKIALSDPERTKKWIKDKIRKFDRGVGYRLFNNAGSFRVNSVGRLALMKARYQSDLQLQTKEQPNVTKFKQLGVPYEEETIERVKKQYDKFIEDENHATTIKYDDEVCSYRLDSPDFDFAEHIPAFADLLNDKVIEAVQETYGTYFKPVRLTAYRNYHVPQEVQESGVYSNNYHTDAHTFDHIKLFVYLDDTGEDDGPFHLISPEESSKIVKLDSFKNKGDNKLVEQETTPTKFTGPAGSAALVNVSLSEHRAGVPEPGHSRDVISFVFAPANKPLPDDWPEQKEMYAHYGHEHNGFTRLFNY